MNDRKPSISDSWIGKDGREYRSIKFWVGAGWTAGFLQVCIGGQWHGT